MSVDDRGGVPDGAWGNPGPGAIARRVFVGEVGSATGQVVAIGMRNMARPNLSRHFTDTRIHGGYDPQLADRRLDAIYEVGRHPVSVAMPIVEAQAGRSSPEPLSLSATGLGTGNPVALAVEAF